MKILIITEANLSNHVYNKWQFLSKGLSGAGCIVDRHTYDLIINCVCPTGIEVFDKKKHKISIVSNIDDLIYDTKDLTLEDTLQLTKIKSML